MRVNELLLICENITCTFLSKKKNSTYYICVILPLYNLILQT